MMAKVWFLMKKKIAGEEYDDSSIFTLYILLFTNCIQNYFADCKYEFLYVQATLQEQNKIYIKS